MRDYGVRDFQADLGHICAPEEGDGPLVQEIKAILAGGLTPSIREAPLQRLHSVGQHEDRVGADPHGVLQRTDPVGVGNVYPIRRRDDAAPDRLPEPRRLFHEFVPDGVPQHEHTISLLWTRVKAKVEAHFARERQP